MPGQAVCGRGVRWVQRMLLLLLLRALVLPAGKDSTRADLYIVREGGAQALTQSDAFVATQQEVRYLYRQQDSGRKLVQQHLAEVRPGAWKCLWVCGGEGNLL